MVFTRLSWNPNVNRPRWIVAAVAGALLIGGLLAPSAFAVREEAGADVPEVQDWVLDERCTATILNQTTRVAPNGLISIPNVPSANVITRLRVVCEREEGVVLAGQSGFIQLVPGETIRIGPLQLGPMEPSVASLTVTQMEVETKGEVDLPAVQLTVMGVLSNEEMVDLTQGSAGTVYTSSNAAIASVDENGLVTRNGSGTAIISIVNDGVFTTTMVQNFIGNDTDLDGLPDDYETALGLDPDDPADAGEDPDMDGLTTLEEFNAGTDPFLQDTDGDALTDQQEVQNTGTNPLVPDTDMDGIIDGEDGTPLNSDGDGDGLPDGVELAITGTNTTDALPNDDADMDGVPNIDEVNVGTDPLVADTDGDGINDGQELLNGSDPLVPDMEPPVVELVTPAPGTSLVEGDTIGIAADVTDLGPIVNVDFLVDGTSLAMINPDPLGPPPVFGESFVTDFTVPAANGSTVDIQVMATDANMNTGTSGVETFDVIPDPGTTVVGRIVDEMGTPVEGADVTLYPGNETAEVLTMSAADGTFMFADAPTIFGNVTVSAFATVDETDLRGSGSAPPVRDGVTDLGDIALIEAFFEENFGEALSISNSDDSFEEVVFTDGFTFPFFGEERTSVFVGSNGYLTFGQGDTFFNAAVPDDVTTGNPRISVLFTDLNPGASIAEAGIFANQFADRFVVTYFRVAQFGEGGENTMQVILFADGRIQYAYNGLTADGFGNGFGSDTLDITVNVTPGGTDATPVQIDYTGGTVSTGANEAPYELFEEDGSFDLDGMFIVFQPNATGGFNIDTIPNPNPMTVAPGQSAGRLIGPGALDAAVGAKDPSGDLEN